MTNFYSDTPKSARTARAITPPHSLKNALRKMVKKIGWTPRGFLREDKEDMKKITYKKLMEKVENGDAEIAAWSNDSEEQVADIFIHTMRSSKRERFVVTAVPIEIRD